MNYNIAVQTPQYQIEFAGRADAHADRAAVGFRHEQHDAEHRGGQCQPVGNGVQPEPVFAGLRQPGRGRPESRRFLSNLARTTRGVSPQIVNHYNVQPVFDVYANVDRQDLGSVGDAVEKIMDGASKKLPKGSSIELRGQVDTMQTSFYRLGLGLIFAIVLVYMLMAVNFQSWLDPFIILMALPGALAGIVWMLFVTQTTFSVPSLMGAIMCIGVATANSILMVVFANDQRMEGHGRASRRRCRRATPHPAGADDGVGDDHRHAADGARVWAKAASRMRRWAAR